MPGARENQLADLRALSLVPDLSMDQTRFRARHLSLFNLARKGGAIYACDCSRKEVLTALSSLASASHDGLAPIYSGECRHRDGSTVAYDGAAAGIAWRFKMPRQDGRNDFIIARTKSVNGDQEFIPAYHWACAIDDFDGAYDLIVRSLDLASALPLQRAIQAWIAEAEKKELPLIRAFHTSLVVQNDGHRLEKRTQGVSLEELASAGVSVAALVDKFERSFDRELISSDSFDLEGVAREKLETLSLDALSLSKT